MKTNSIKLNLKKSLWGFVAAVGLIGDDAIDSERTL